MQDKEIIEGLMNSYDQRAYFEKEFYHQYKYFIQEGCRKYKLSYDDSFSAYSDALLAAIINIINKRFDNTFSLKTYLFKIFSNKCVDLLRRISNNRESVNRSATVPELLNFLPDTAKNVIENIIEQEKIRVVRQYLEKIGDKCKEILLMFEDGYSDREISEKLSYNNPAVAKTTRLRCREKLKSLLSGNEQFT